MGLWNSREELLLQIDGREAEGEHEDLWGSGPQRGAEVLDMVAAEKHDGQASGFEELRRWGESQGEGHLLLYSESEIFANTRDAKCSDSDEGGRDVHNPRCFSCLLQFWFCSIVLLLVPFSAVKCWCRAPAGHVGEIPAQVMWLQDS